MHSVLHDCQWCSRYSRVHGLVVRQTREPTVKIQCERCAAGDPHWASAFTWLLHEGQEMSGEIDLTEAARELAVFVCLLFCFVL